MEERVMSDPAEKIAFDSQRASAFASRLLGVLNDGALCLMGVDRPPHSCLHCMTVSLAQGGEGLGAMWGEEKTREYLERAGFREVTTKKLAHDVQNNWYVVRK
jgi:hypothetical protein